MVIQGPSCFKLEGQVVVVRPSEKYPGRLWVRVRTEDGLRTFDNIKYIQTA
jgi:hypothetical protein